MSVILWESGEPIGRRSAAGAPSCAAALERCAGHDVVATLLFGEREQRRGSDRFPDIDRATRTESQLEGPVLRAALDGPTKRRVFDPADAPQRPHQGLHVDTALGPSTELEPEALLRKRVVLAPAGHRAVHLAPVPSTIQERLRVVLQQQVVVLVARRERALE